MLFSEQERRIYRSPDGRDYDPLRAYLELRVAAGGVERVNTWLDDIDHHARLRQRVADGQEVPAEELRAADVADAAAHKSLVAAARVAFGYDKGHLDAIVLETLADFLRYLEGKGSPAASGPISPPASDSAPGWIVPQVTQGHMNEETRVDTRPSSPYT